jgi:acyl carrier protein
MDQKNILKTLYEIGQTFVTDEKQDLNHEDDEKNFFNYLISDSVQAVNFVLLIEDEFEIEFDDDDIDLNFYSRFDHIAELIYIRLSEKTFR